VFSRKIKGDRYSMFGSTSNRPRFPLMSFSNDPSHFLEQLVLSSLRKRVSAPKTFLHAMCETCLWMIGNAICSCSTSRPLQFPSNVGSSIVWLLRLVSCGEGRYQ
jgi:hypothetical protein